MATTTKVTFQLRKDLEVNWNSKNPILLEGEPGYATDTHVFKIGDGTTGWKELPALINFNQYTQLLARVAALEEKIANLK